MFLLCIVFQVCIFVHCIFWLMILNRSYNHVFIVYCKQQELNPWLRTFLRSSRNISAERAKSSCTTVCRIQAFCRDLIFHPYVTESHTSFTPKVSMKLTVPSFWFLSKLKSSGMPSKQLNSTVLKMLFQRTECPKLCVSGCSGGPEHGACWYTSQNRNDPSVNELFLNLKWFVLSRINNIYFFDLLPRLFLQRKESYMSASFPFCLQLISAVGQQRT